MSFHIKLIATKLIATKVIGTMVLCLLGAPAHVAENIRFSHASVEQGLSQMSAQAIVQDPEGFVWIGTQHGLNRYDGHAFVSYFHDSADLNSLSNDWVWTLLVATNGTLWAGTKQGGLNQFNPVSGSFTRHLTDSNALGSSEVRALAEDGQGRLWIGTDGAGVTRYDPASGQYKHFRYNPDDVASLSNDRVKALHVDGSGFVWIGTDGGGLNRLDPVREQVTRIRLGGDDGSRVRSIVPDARGMLWVGTNERGLYLVDPTKGVTRHFSHVQGDATSLSSSSIRVLFVDSHQQLWVGTDSHGLNRFDPVRGTFMRVQHEASNPRSLSDNHVASIFQDRGGVIWVGTHAGINTWNPLTGAFRNYARREDQPGSLSNNSIVTFAEHADGRLYVGTAGGGINLMDLETGVSERVDAVDGATSLSDDRVFALALGDAGELWAGTRAGGLNRYDPQTRQWRAYRHDPEVASSLSSDGVTSLLLDSSRQLWVGTYGGGLSRYDPMIDGFQHYRHQPEQPESLCDDRVLALYQDQAQRLWVGTHGGGICRLDPVTGRFDVFRHDPGDPQSLSSDEAWAIEEDASGNLWIGTSDRGLNLWRAPDREAGQIRFSRIGTEQGLLSPVTYGLLSDNRGRLWVSSNRGLTRIDGDSLDMRAYTIVDGLQGNEFNFAAAYRARNGQLFFGGPQGFSAFFPERIGVNTHPPQMALTGFQRNYTTTRLDMAQDETGRLVLDHTDQLVTFEYVALDFTAPEHNVYEHFLEGFDDGWVNDAGRHRVTYTNLQPGDYELRVRAANNDGVWSSEELRIPITVQPAPWVSWYAITIYVLALLMIIYFVYRVQAQRLARAAQLNEVQSSLITEITERQVKEAELARTRARSQRYLDVVEVIILALDKYGNVTLVNQKGVRVLGYAESEIIGRNFYDCFVPEKSRDEVRTRFEHVDQYAYSESPIKPKEGTERMIAWHTIPLPPMDKDHNDASAGILISGADVTQMRSLERQLRDAQKMEALGTLARGVAHDFNNILSSILGYAELTQTEMAGSSKAVAYLQKLQSSVERARELVHRILTFGRGGGQVILPVRVNQVVEEALELIRPAVHPNVVIEEQLEPDCGAVLADSAQLVQVLLNLGTNAVQAMGDAGGTLRIELSRYEVGIEEARSLAVLVPGPHVRLVVSDTGPGMDDFTLQRIFDPFFTTRERDEGTGLGLAVVHGIVTQLKGSVQVFSKPEEGSRFEVLLPCCAEEPMGEVSDLPVEADSLQGSETVLFVDDEPSVRAIAEEALGNLGYRVLTAGNGIEALEVFDNPGVEFDVVITDQSMPLLMGDKLAEAIKLRRPGVPVVLMSGADHPDSKAIDHFVEKPFTLATLGQAVRVALAQVT